MKRVKITLTPSLAQVLAASNDGGAQQIKNIADPTDAQDAATKVYVDSIASSLTLAQVLANGRNVDAAGTINTSSGGFAINVNAGTLYSTTLLTGSLDWNSAQLSNASGVTLDWNTLALSGNWTGVTQSAGDNSTRLATTAYVDGTVSGYVPTSRTITINGSAQDLSSNRTWTITVTGTANRIAVSGGAGLTPTINIDPTYIGQTSITTLGTVAFGTWQANSVGLAYGGTNNSLLAVNGGIVYSTATAMSIAAAGSSGQLLSSTGAGAPVWTTATYPTTVGATGTILRSNGTNWVASTNTYPDTTGVGQILYATSVNGISSSSTFVRLTTGELVVGGSALVSTESFSFQKDQNANTQITLSNTTDGTAARSRIAVNSGTTSVNNVIIAAYSNSFTTSGIAVAGTGNVFSAASAGLNIGTTAATQFSFWSNNTERARFLSSGEFIVNATSLISTELVSIQKNQNAGTFLYLSNTTSGTASRTAYIVATNGALGMSMNAYSPAFTTSGIQTASCSVILSNQLGGMNIGNTAATQLSFWTNNTERMRFLSTGEGLFGYSTVGSSETWGFGKNQNAGTYAVIKNTTSGTVAYTGWVLSDSDALTLNTGVYHLNTSYTTSGMFVANTAAFSTTASAGMNIGTRGSTQLSFWTNNTEKMRINSAGEVGIGMTAVNTVDITANGNAHKVVKILNSDSGTGAGSWFRASNGTSDIWKGVYGTGFTTSGIAQANAGFLQYVGTVGLYINSAHASGAPIIFVPIGTAVANEAMRILATKQVLIGATSLVASETFLVQNNQNAETHMKVWNTTSGTAATAAYYAGNGSTTFVMRFVSAGFTSSGINVANTSVISTSQTAGLNIGTTSNTQFSFWTNNTQKAVLEAAGNFVVGDTASISTNNIGHFRKDVNGTTFLSAVNATSGTSAGVGIVASVSSTSATEMSIYALSALKTTSGALIANTGVLWTNMSAGMNIAVNSNAQMSFWTNNTKRIELTAGGGLIVGTDFSPILTEASGYYISSSGTDAGIQVVSTTASGATSGAKLFLGSDDNAAVVNGDRLAQILFGGSQSSSAITSGATIEGWANETWSSTTRGSYMTFGTCVGGGSLTISERMRITNAGNIKIAGTAVRGTTEGTNHLSIFDGTAPAGTLANGVTIYSGSGKLKSADAAGTIGHILSVSAVNNVSPTAQNRTLTVDVGGTTLYITAKTTND